MTLARDGAHWRGTVDVLIAQVATSEAGTVSASFPVALSLSDDERNRGRGDGAGVERTLTIRPRMHQLRVIARDVVTGNVGSLVIPLRPPTRQ